MTHRTSRRQFLAASSTAIASFALGTGAVKAADEIKEIVWALPSVNDTMFVPRAWSTYVGAIMSLVQEGPLAFGDDLALIPGVTTAEQPDATTYKYHIRQGSLSGTVAPSRPTTSSQP